MSRLPAKYRLLKRLDQQQATQAVAEVTGVEIDVFTLAQSCSDAGTPATVELPLMGTTMWHGPQRRDFSGLHRITAARKGDPYYDFKASITIEADGLSWETSIDLMQRPMWFTPLALEALIDRLSDYKAQSSGLLQLQEILEQERIARRALEEEREARLTAEAPPKPSYILVISALLELLKDPVEHARPNGRPQSAIIGEILDRFPLHGLSERNLEEVFSEANKARKKIE
ncbi:hypothetical protein [Pseudomonas sp. GV085]|uniref:hypothetical protein n=1 Tax=Pseudomonas sp. GV085 TaxID=2135756 RepID=UPI000D337A62|nr:hypothetical protein [Pseudomonas sp. GV085]PTR29618.1 hypothetical protein C8K63_101511 [Pseudomonas sp. GV085]